MRYSKTMVGRYHTIGAAHTYTIIRDDRRWLLVIRRREEVAGVVVGSADVVDSDWHDTLALAKATAQAFEDLGEDFQPHQHGGQNRGTVAVGIAYEAAA